MGGVHLPAHLAVTEGVQQRNALGRIERHVITPHRPFPITPAETTVRARMHAVQQPSEAVTVKLAGELELVGLPAPPPAQFVHLTLR
jgi:hypothetical protein